MSRFQPVRRPYRADMVRIVHADASPAWLCIKLYEMVAAFSG
jgi:hypothetical protein